MGNKLFKGNLAIKMISFLSALLLWIYVMGVVDPIDTKDITVNTINFTYANNAEAANEFVTVGEIPSVRLKLKGKTGDITRAVSKGISVTGIFSNPKVGDNAVLLKADLPSSINYEIVPGDLIIQLDKLKVESKIIEVMTFGKIGGGKEVHKIDTNVRSTYIEGPASLIEKVDKVIIPIDLDGQTEDFSRKVQPQAVDENGDVIPQIKCSVDYVFVEISLSYTKTIPVKINLINEIGEPLYLSGYTTEPAKVSANGITAAMDELKSLDTEEISGLKLRELINGEILIRKSQDIRIHPEKVRLVRVPENLVDKVLEYDASEVELKNFTEEEKQQIYKDIPSILYLTVSASKELESDLDKSLILVVLNKEHFDLTSGIIPFECFTNVPIDDYSFDVKGINLHKEKAAGENEN